MEEEDSVEGDLPPLTDVLKEIALLPLRLLVSKQAIRAYLNTAFIIFAALTLYAISIVTYAYFYYRYIPNVDISTPIHLQFDHTTNSPYTHEESFHPHGISSLVSSSGASSVLLSQQNYDVHVKLSLPRTSANVHAGNFMVSLSLLAPSSRLAMSPYSPVDHVLVQKPNATVLATSSRPTSLKHISPLIEYGQKLIHLPSYILGWRQESEALNVQMMRGVSFERGWRNVPAAVWVEVRSTERLHVYGCEVNVRATLRGVRWLMYNHRIFSFLAMTGIFWFLELSTALFIWLVASVYFASGDKGAPKHATAKVEGSYPAAALKREEGQGARDDGEEEEDDDDADNMSDTERTFPTYAGQPALRYSSPIRGRVKVEEESPVKAENVGAADADISGSDLSNEDADIVVDELETRRRRRDYDSGIGTSMDSSAGSSGLSRRSGKGRGK